MTDWPSSDSDCLPAQQAAARLSDDPGVAGDSVTECDVTGDSV